MGEKVGYIYILTNPSFPGYVKIGYSRNVDARVKKLNSSECIPFGFRVFATYEVSFQTPVDVIVHELIDLLNPELHLSEVLDNKLRKREFFAMAPERAYRVLELMAALHNRTDALTQPRHTPDEEQEEEDAKEIDTMRTERAANFSFSKCGITPNELVTFEWNGYDSVQASVVNDRQVEYQGQTYYLTALAKKLLGRNIGVQGPLYFKYKDKRLTELRADKENVDNIQQN